jgi:hypothetical protein
MKAKLLVVPTILIAGKNVMFRALELITLDILCSHSNAVPEYLEQTIRDTQPVGPV